MMRALIIALTVAFCAAYSPAEQASESLSADTPKDDTSNVFDEDEVKAAVNRFLIAIGNYDLDALPPMFTANANIGSVRFRNGELHTKTYTFEEFYSVLKARSNPSRYQEPVSHFTVHIEAGGLAFVRADATLIRDNIARSRNIDYFTLIKEGGTWKFLSASYITTPIAK